MKTFRIDLKILTSPNPTYFILAESREEAEEKLITYLVYGSGYFDFSVKYSMGRDFDVYHSIVESEIREVDTEESVDKILDNIALLEEKIEYLQDGLDMNIKNLLEKCKEIGVIY